MSQKMTAVPTVYSLPMAEVALWSGDEVVGAETKLWDAKQQTSFQVRENPMVVERRPTGIPHPRRRILVTEYEINLEGVFNQDVAILEDGEYILVVKFTEAALHTSGLKWLSRTFYGVTFVSKDLVADGIDAMKGSITLVANYVEDETGEEA